MNKHQTKYIFKQQTKKKKDKIVVFITIDIKTEMQ